MTVTYDVWLRTVFDHPSDGPEWFWAPDFDALWDSLELSGAVTVDYLTRLYKEPAVLRGYSLEQVAQGIWFLVGEASPAQPTHSLLDHSVLLEVRVDCVKAIASFFREFVAPMAPGEADIDGDSFHVACYMWWDIFPTWGGNDAGEHELHQACLKVMAESLRLSSELCVLSALHGLSHWHEHHDREVEQIIDTFLAGAKDLSARVHEYAASTRRGIVQ